MRPTSQPITTVMKKDKTMMTITVDTTTTTERIQLCVKISIHASISHGEMVISSMPLMCHAPVQWANRHEEQMYEYLQ